MAEAGDSGCRVSGSLAKGRGVGSVGGRYDSRLTIDEFGGSDGGGCGCDRGRPNLGHIRRNAIIEARKTLSFSRKSIVAEVRRSKRYIPG